MHTAAKLPVCRNYSHTASLLLLFISLSGCLPRYYPGIQGTHTPTHIFTPKSIKSSNVMQIDMSNAAYYNFNETNLIMRNHLLKCNRARFASANIGFLLYGGLYEVKGLHPDYDGNYEYFGAGPEVSLAAFLPLRNLKIGCGLYGNVIVEHGAYHNFMKDSNDEGLAENDLAPIYPNLGVFTFFGFDVSDE